MTYLVWYALYWDYNVAIIFTTVFVIHEIGHALMSAYCGIRIHSLFVFVVVGAVVFDSIENTDDDGRILVYLGGAIASTVAVGFAALFLPMVDDYPSFARLGLFVFAAGVMNFLNLLPIYPLDGGKVVYLLLQKLNVWVQRLILGMGLVFVVFLLASVSFTWFTTSILVLGVIVQLGLFISTFSSSNQFSSFKSRRKIRHFLMPFLCYTSLLFVLGLLAVIALAENIIQLGIH